MIRRIIEIDEEKCNGCGACADACHEGAIAMVDGKAKLMRDDYCDGLGDCLPGCSTGQRQVPSLERSHHFHRRKDSRQNLSHSPQGRRRGKPTGVPAGHWWVYAV